MRISQRRSRGDALLSSLDPDCPPLPVIFGLAGTSLKKDEAALFKAANPLGFILFARNCKNPGQVKKLTDSLHKTMGRTVPVLIDQEGGRVMRMKPPVWPDRPAAKTFGDRLTNNKDKDKVRRDLADHIEAISSDLTQAGVNVNCAPVLDVLTAETHKVIGDRAFSSDVSVVSELGKIACGAYLDNGIVPVMKHMPGHGRAALDSHKDLPVVAAKRDDLRAQDYTPFGEILTQAFSEAVWGMVAHVVYSDIDDDVPASCSRRVIWDEIRGEIGFYGLLLSDDIGMDALASYGTADRRAEAVLRAGCDIALHCSGDMTEMKAIVAGGLKMRPDTVKRYNKTASWMQQMHP